MPIQPVACAVLLTALALPSLCTAADNETTVDPSAAAPSQNLFTSWFTSRASRTDAKVDPTPDVDVAAPQPAPTAASRASDLVVNALGLLGISYRMGGNTPASGFDCSGMVRYVFQNVVGLSLPRRAEEISRVGMKISKAELKPGDLVFYKTLRQTFSHVGIYLGNNRFIHAPSAGGAVRVDDMTEGYWATRFTGARRVNG
jgi:cell wall-associated NlpC family hydrolase